MIKKTYVLSLLALIVLSTFVFAAGSSTGNTDDSNSDVRKAADSRVVCEDKETVRDRIKCRLENSEVVKSYGYSVVEEACRDDRFKERCEALYERSAKCYDENNAVEKKRCFLKEAGISVNAASAFRAAPSEAKREYVVLLLYEVQERIEKLQESGKITSDQASSLIEKIVEIKKMVLAGEPRSEIVPKIQEFKKEYREMVAEMVRQSRDDNSSKNSTNSTTNNTSGDSA